MLKKIKSYYRTFGFSQTVLKLFRYCGERFRTDGNGIYTPSGKEKRVLSGKARKVYVFSDRKFGDGTASEYASVFNGLGCAVYYYCLGEKIKKLKNPPLCGYGVFSSKAADGMSFEDSIVVLDTEGEMRLPITYKTKKEKCVVIDTSAEKRAVDADLCADYLNLLTNKRENCGEFYGKISVVVLNYNNTNVIFNCLDTLIKYNGRYGYEIIVVDNQSTDGSYEEIQKRYPGIKLCRNVKNGCSSGRNLGIESSEKDYVIFLDSDQWILHKNWLDVYLDVFGSADNIGALGWTGGWFNRKGYSFHTVNNFTYGYMPPKGLYRSDIGYLGTGGMMVAKSLLEKIDGFDVNYDPTCYEDTDISLKIRNEGKEIYFCPYLGVGHLPHQTTKSGSEAHEKLIKAKGDYFLDKWKKKNPKLLKYVK